MLPRYTTVTVLVPILHLPQGFPYDCYLGQQWLSVYPRNVPTSVSIDRQLSHHICLRGQSIDSNSPIPSIDNLKMVCLETCHHLVAGNAMRY